MRAVNAPQQGILLVDDSPEELAALEASLAPLGQRLVRAHSGQEALKKILVEDFACILLDARMPGLDGRETALFIHALERTRHVPLLFLTEGEEAGAVDCVARPVEPELLRARVRELLESPRMRPTVRPPSRPGGEPVRDEPHLEREWELLHCGRELDVATANLCEREEHFRAVISALLEGIILHDDQGRVLLANQSAERLLGLSSLEMVGRASQDPRWGSLHGDGRPCPAEELPTLVALRTGRAVTGAELGVHQPDGRLVWLCVNAQPIFGSDGVTPTGVVASFLDITERKQVEARLEASERQFRTLAEALPETVWMAEPPHGLIYVNGALPGFTGLAVDELLGMGFLSIIHPDHRARSQQLWSRAMEEETPLQVEHLVRGRDGSYRWHLVRGVPVRDDAGRVVKWVGLSADVHESRQAQQELQRRADSEQHLVGMVSHDLRNPLNAILLTTRSLLRRGGLDEGQTRGVERIQGSVERAIRMIRDLLDFTQARLGGGILLERQRVDMHEVVRGVLDEVEVAHPGREVRWVREGCGLGEWDADRIAQVMQNLVTNALKYSPEGTPVRVESRGVEEALVLSVHNGGTPIAPGKMERLFQPFQRATAEVDKAGRSVGLGLYIVKHLVDAHGGALDVRSTCEEGTTFTVRVPRTGG
ncbi:PAS domain S-box protein [Cystobacter fuscus]|uniref:PAS domain S-box protein n=1 Tax=Cystobacter fuscus TaxID=43 RepID=UPI0037C04117